MQSLAARVVEGAKSLVRPTDSGALAGVPESVALELASLRHQLASQQVRISAVEQENHALTRFRRLWPRTGKLIAAQVVGQDAMPWRGSILLAAGTRRGVARNQGVASAYFVDAGAENGLTAGMAVLSGEALVGFIERADAYSSRVRLLTDSETRMPVTLGRWAADQFHPLETRFWMTGADGGNLIVRDVDHGYLVDGKAAEGDAVLSVNDDPRIPASLVIGSVMEVLPRRDNPLLVDLRVRPAVVAAELRRVYVIEP